MSAAAAVARFHDLCLELEKQQITSTQSLTPLFKNDSTPLGVRCRDLVRDQAYLGALLPPKKSLQNRLLKRVFSDELQSQRAKLDKGDANFVAWLLVFYMNDPPQLFAARALLTKLDVAARRALFKNYDVRHRLLHGIARHHATALARLLLQGFSPAKQRQWQFERCGPTDSDIPLHIAVRTGGHELTDYFLKALDPPDRLAALDTLDQDNRKPLHQAVAAGDQAMAQLLLEAVAEPQQMTLLTALDGKGRTPLHYAAGRGDVAMAAMLLEGRSDPERRRLLAQTERLWGMTALGVACEMGHLAMARYLLQGCSGQQRLQTLYGSGQGGGSPLSAAFWAPPLQRTILLSGLMADLTPEQRRRLAYMSAHDHKDNPLLARIVATGDQQLTALFFEGADGYEKERLLTECGFGPLREALHRVDTPMVELLLGGLPPGGKGRLLRGVYLHALHHLTDIKAAGAALAGRLLEGLDDKTAQALLTAYRHGTPLHSAVFFGNHALVAVLFTACGAAAKRPYCFQTDDKGMTSFQAIFSCSTMTAACRRNKEEAYDAQHAMVLLFFEGLSAEGRVALLTAHSWHSEMAIHTVAKDADLRMMTALLAGLNPHHKEALLTTRHEKSGATLLTIVAARDDSAMLDLLLADLTPHMVTQALQRATASGGGPLHQAAGTGATQAVARLAALIEDDVIFELLSQKDDDDASVLHCAISGLVKTRHTVDVLLVSLCAAAGPHLPKLLTLRDAKGRTPASFYAERFPDAADSAIHRMLCGQDR